MSSGKELAAAAKARGNTAFQSGDYSTAVTAFTEAISHDPTDHVFFSNRSGAYASLNEFESALKDADECIKLKPDFVKGYSRAGHALFKLGKLKEAKEAYEKGLKVDAGNAQLKEGLDETERALTSKSSNPMGELFGPSMWVKLQADPTTRPMLADPSFVAKLQALQSNPNAMGTMLQDPQLQKALSVILGINLASAGGPGPSGPTGWRRGGAGAGADTDSGVHVEDEDDEDVEEIPAAKPAPKPVEKKIPEPAKKPELSEADQEKEKGNLLYKKKQWSEALVHYKKAVELQPTNVVYYNNIAAVHFEAKNYDEALITANKAIEVGRENSANFKDLAKAYGRLGNIYLAQNKLDEAIEAYNKALVEDYDEKIKNQLKKVNELKKKAEAEAYLDPVKSEEAKTRGNALFQEGKWVDAIGEYTEALKRDPTNYKVYSNRAACYSKLMDWQRGLEDCDACLKVDPKFVKAYIRKGKIQHFLKQYHKALETFEKGLQIDPSASELIDARRATLMQINTSAGDPERAKEAMKDPEIQAILRDPTINKVLADLQSSPESGQAALKDPDIRAKIEKLIAAGVLAVK